MFPFIQCHQTRGRAALGGFSNPFFSPSSDAWATENPVLQSMANAATANRLQLRLIIPISPGISSSSERRKASVLGTENCFVPFRFQHQGMTVETQNVILNRLRVARLDPSLLREGAQHKSNPE